MTAKAELIQASNNTATNTAIFTFLLTYQRESWLDYVGLSRFFSDRLTVRRYVTATHNFLIDAGLEVKFAVYEELRTQMMERRDFARYIFSAVGRGGRISGTDVQKAIDLFGPNFQNVLKQYKPGEMHLPPGLSADDHGHVATDDPCEPWFPLADGGSACG